MPRTLRLPLLAALVLVAVVALVPALPLRADAVVASSPGMEADFDARVNALRSSLGLAPMTIDGNLVALAEEHTSEMIAAGKLFHAPDLSVGLTESWQFLGENVGRGSNVDAIWNAFLNSPTHYANLVNPRFTHLGIGVIEADGMVWTTQRFLQPGAAAAPAPAPAPAAPTTGTTPAPRPAASTTTTAPTTTAPPAPAPPAPVVPTTEAPSDPAPAQPGHVDALLVAMRALS